MSEVPETQVAARLWDVPVRLVHWALVLLIGFSWWAAETDRLQWHRWSGYAILGLVFFRLLWGIWGSRTARFSSFLKGPGASLAYLKSLGSRAPADAPGHNPVGAWSVVAILAVLIFQVTTGLFAVDIDAFEAGPLSDRVSFETGRAISELHEASFTVLQVLVAVHVVAVFWYLIWKRSNLIGAMFTGRRKLSADPGVTFAPWWRVLATAVVAAAAAWALSRGLRF
ncbi:cytochrome b/b6 domain-containing protein [Phenylobacterium sp. J367]|uniref:cytochrome b/b6 domain-containing protein n=1 Tax=Phenylobacterium sp. J367 TaxID=2898435 RepID=UPI002150DCFC|nr:cytochrome b/b6 domain-containing protein [Phenylobacterium sp. J367]MCR5880890.1 cytochrome b/b6 domain-containing protein [Phenylobacterium sp. J367]